MKLTRQLLSIGCALLVSTVLASAIPGRAEVKGTKGPVTVTKAAGGSVPATVGMVLGAGDTIATGSGGWVDVWLGLNGEALRLTPESTLKFEVLDIAHIGNRHFTTRLKLTQGRLLSLVKNKPTAASRLEFATPNFIAQIRDKENTGSSITTQRATVLTGRLTVRRVGLASSGAEEIVDEGMEFDSMRFVSGPYPATPNQIDVAFAGGGGPLGGGGGGAGGGGGGLGGLLGMAAGAGLGYSASNNAGNNPIETTPLAP